MSTNEAGHRSPNVQPLIRWGAFTGMGLLAARKLAGLLAPGLLPSNRWQPEFWQTGLLAAALFESMILLLLLAVPILIYRFRQSYTSSRDLLIDCAAAVGLYLSALLFL